MDDYLINGLYILTLVIWIWALYDLFTSSLEKRATKALWFIAILMFPIIGSLVYFQLGRKSAAREAKKFKPNFNKVR